MMIAPLTASFPHCISCCFTLNGVMSLRTSFSRLMLLSLSLVSYGLVLPQISRAAAPSAFTSLAKEAKAELSDPIEAGRRTKNCSVF